jgi:hypothetical protein
MLGGTVILRDRFLTQVILFQQAVRVGQIEQIEASNYTNVELLGIGVIECLSQLASKKKLSITRPI